MKVIILKLDDPSNKYEWWLKDIVIKAPDDLEKLMGYSASHLYADIYQIDTDDSPDLVAQVQEILSVIATCSVRDTLMRLFTFTTVAIDFSGGLNSARTSSKG